MTDQVYFMRLGDDGPVKIGWSSNVELRFSQLYAVMPDPLYLEATMNGGRELEQRLHRALHMDRRHARKEWFNRSPEVNDLINMAKTGGTRLVEAWLLAKEYSIDDRIQVDHTCDFEEELRRVIALAFKLAVQRRGLKIIADHLGKSGDMIGKYGAGISVPPGHAMYQLAEIDPGAALPFFRLTGGIPLWMQSLNDCNAADAIAAILRKAGPRAA